VLDSDHSNAVRRLNELRATMPADHTLQNLLGVLNAKLELCSKLPIYEYEAVSQGHTHCVRAFQLLAERERSSFDEILATLRVHLDITAAAHKPSDVAGGVT
jgi:hypothetical protein